MKKRKETKKEKALRAQADAEVMKMMESIRTTIIPALPKDSYITVVSQDPDFKGGVVAWFIINNGVIGASFGKKKDAPKILEYALLRGFVGSGVGFNSVLVVKTADDVKYFRFDIDNLNLTNVDFETGKQAVNQIVKYRGKPLAETPFNKLRKSEAMFVIALLEKNDVLKARPKAA
jgi:hypothetical protein